MRSSIPNSSASRRVDDRGAVDRHEGSFPSRRQLVNLACDQLLANPALALDQHREPGGRDPLDPRANGSDRRARSHDRGRTPDGRDRGSGPGCRQNPGALGPVDDQDERGQLPGRLEELLIPFIKRATPIVEQHVDGAERKLSAGDVDRNGAVGRPRHRRSVAQLHLAGVQELTQFGLEPLAQEAGFTAPRQRRRDCRHERRDAATSFSRANPSTSHNASAPGRGSPPFQTRCHSSLPENRNHFVPFALAPASASCNAGMASSVAAVVSPAPGGSPGRADPLGGIASRTHSQISLKDRAARYVTPLSESIAATEQRTTRAATISRRASHSRCTSTRDRGVAGGPLRRARRERSDR